MPILQLDNPVWHALAGAHQHWAQRAGDLSWYPPAIAPFVSVPEAGVLPDLQAARSLGFGDAGYFLGVCPSVLPRDWHYTERSLVLQLLPPESPPALGADAMNEPREVTVLNAGQRPRMLELAQVVFPDFFRPRTAELGDYVGFFEGENLVAMAGERLALADHQEISGVCTRPGYSGRGYARRLTANLLLRHRLRNARSFLHVSESNAAARRLYEFMGFTLRATLQFGRIEHRP